MTLGGDFAYTLRDVRVVFGDGALAKLDEAIDATLRASRILLVSTPGRADVSAAASDVLGSRVTAAYDRAMVHVPTKTVSQALDLFRSRHADCVVAVGGGSAIGLGKAVVKETGTPLVAVPTTYSGSEMTAIWGITDGDRKVTGRDERVAPSLVVYDPQLTHSLPPAVTGPSGVNAIAHAVEALYSPTENPVARLLAAEGIRRLATALPPLIDDPVDRVGRREAFCGAHLCGRALDMTTMGLHHKLCHALGGILNLPHAPTHAVVLPHVTAYNASAAPEAMATIAACLGVSNAARGLWHLNRTLGIRQTLADLGMEDGDVDRVVEAVTTQAFPNPAAVHADGVREVLNRAMAGDAPQ